MSIFSIKIMMTNLIRYSFLSFAILTLQAFSLSSKKTSLLGKGINFNSWSIEKALEKAQEENKPIFVSVYTNTCGVCKKLKKTSFKDEYVGQFFNENYINIAVNGKTNEGKSFMASLNLNSVPSLVFISPKGAIKYVASGYFPAPRLLSLGKHFAE